MQSFLGLLHFDSPPSSSSPPLKSNRPVSLDEVEGEDDSQREFACPFCYEDFDIGSLCYHLEHEHHLESKSAACPVCAAKVGKDMVAHITLQHGHFFKMQRRRRFRMATTSSSSTIPLISKEFWEASLQAHLEGFTDRSALSTPHDGMDPLLSNFVYTLPIPDSGYASKPTATSDEACPVSLVSTDLHNTSLLSPPAFQECDQKLEEAALRSKFVQQLVLSTIFTSD